MRRVSCSDFLSEIGNLLEDEVSSEIRAHLEEHLAGCKVCQVVYDSTRKTIIVLTDTESFELPVGELKSGAQAIMARIRALNK